MTSVDNGYPHRFLVPEVVQTSSMDCGPAALKSLLEGFGIPVSYGRLREACQTTVDGTSIDALEDVANQLGLVAQQTIVPLEHLLLNGQSFLPAVVVTRQPNGMTHFVVAWRVHIGGLVQVMDPASGRTWRTTSQFLNDIYRHRAGISANRWREWAGSEGFVASLRQLLRQINVLPETIDDLLDRALADESWYGLATLDAATRMVGALVKSGGLTTHLETSQLLNSLFEQVHTQKDKATQIIPVDYWLVRPKEDDSTELSYIGAVVLQIVGRRTSTSLADQLTGTPTESATLTPELVSALQDKTPRPETEIFNLLRQDGVLTPLVVTLAFLLSAIGVTIEALFLGQLLNIEQSIASIRQQYIILGALFGLAVVLVSLEYPINMLMYRIGRHLEMNWRLAFLKKIPKLGDQYFYSRLTSDMARRAHEIYILRRLPRLGFTFLRSFMYLVLTIVALAWIDPASAPLAILTALLAIGIAVLKQPILGEIDLRLQAIKGGLSTFYLDTLLGIVPIRSHNAGNSLKREHNILFVSWVRTSLGFYNVAAIIELLSLTLLNGLAITIVFSYVWRNNDPGLLILLTYWSLNLVALGREMGRIALQYPQSRNRIVRLLEPLQSPDLHDPLASSATDEPEPEPPQTVVDRMTAPTPAPPTPSVKIDFDKVQLQIGGHIILNRIDLSVGMGEHIAIVGHSGSGKSSLVGLLLGWYRTSAGQILIDGQPLDSAQLAQLRRDTVWVDPSVQIWNRSFLDNLRYGSEAQADAISPILKQADLVDVLKRLPNGMQTVLGESGGLISGGEGQRVRFGRGLLHSDTKLVILDEPFRGLDHTQRIALMARARQLWANATLICVTHDVTQTEQFDRVVVMSEGRIIEDASPTQLQAQTESHYNRLLTSATAVQNVIKNTEWREVWLEEGHLREQVVS